MTGVDLIERRFAVASLAERGFSDMDRNYGPDSPNPLDYHNIDHVRSSTEAASAIGLLALTRDRISIKGVGQVIVSTANHDKFQGFGRGIDELLSADATVELMHEENIRRGIFVFDEEDFTIVHSAITGTNWHMDENGHLVQHIRDNATYVEKIVVDGDVFTFGAEPPLCWDGGINLHREFNDGAAPEGPELVSFAKKQIQLLEGHRFKTEEAEELYPNRALNIEHAQDMLSAAIADL